jgi:S1-C subfamily serine protease
VTVCGRITSIGGTTIANNNDLHNAMESFQVGQSVSLTWMDASAVSHSATVTLGQAGFPD